MTPYIGAIDQGTSSTRFMIFDTQGRINSIAKKEHDRICQQPGWEKAVQRTLNWK